MRNFHPPPTSDQVVDGDGRAFSPKTGYQYVGYVCSAFQRLEVTSHHIDKSTRQAGNKRAAVELQREASGMTRASGAKDLAEQHQSDLTEQCAQFHLEREQLLVVVRASEARANAARRSQAQLELQMHNLLGQLASIDAKRLVTSEELHLANQKLRSKDVELEEKANQLASLGVNMDDLLEELQETRRQRDKEVGLRKASLGRFAEQRTQDGRILSSIDSAQKLYAALRLQHLDDGTPISVVVFQRSSKGLHDMSDRHLRRVIATAKPVVDRALRAIHDDTDGLLALLVADASSAAVSAKRQIMMQALGDLPLVQDVVQAINNATTTEEEQRLLSILGQHFTNAEMNNDLGLTKAVTRRKFYFARSHAKAWGAGATAPKIPITRQRVNATQFEDALRWIANPDNMQAR